MPLFTLERNKVMTDSAEFSRRNSGYLELQKRQLEFAYVLGMSLAPALLRAARFGSTRVI
jgi:hypothetical protein